jgi:hypothetical protein
MDTCLSFLDEERINHSFAVDVVEIIRSPKLGWYIEFFSNNETKRVWVSSANEAYDLYHFLVNIYNPSISNFSKYKDEDKIEFLIDNVGRDSNESPYSVSSVKIFLLFFDSTDYKRMYYREI